MSILARTSHAARLPSSRTRARFPARNPLRPLLTALLLPVLLALSSCDRADPLGVGFGAEEGPDASAPASASAGNEPSGLSTLTEHAFDALDGGGWSYNSTKLASIVTDESTPGTCCSVAEARYPRGFEGGSSPLTTWYQKFDSREIYVSFHLKFSDNWQQHMSGVSKIGFVWIHDDPAVYFATQGNGTMRPRIRLQNTPDGGRNLEANVSDAAVERGEWHRWEIYMVANTPGIADGVARLWLDGQLVMDHSDVLYSGASEESRWQHVYWAPVWGGRFDSVEQEMTLRISDYYASVR